MASNTSFGNLLKYARHVRKTGKCTPAGLKEFNLHNDLDVKYDERTGEFEINVELVSNKPKMDLEERAKILKETWLKSVNESQREPITTEEKATWGKLMDEINEEIE